MVDAGKERSVAAATIVCGAFVDIAVGAGAVAIDTEIDGRVAATAVVHGAFIDVFTGWRSAIIVRAAEIGGIAAAAVARGTFVDIRAAGGGAVVVGACVVRWVAATTIICGAFVDVITDGRRAGDVLAEVVRRVAAATVVDRTFVNVFARGHPATVIDAGDIGRVAAAAVGRGAKAITCPAAIAIIPATGITGASTQHKKKKNQGWTLDGWPLDDAMHGRSLLRCVHQTPRCAGDSMGIGSAMKGAARRVLRGSHSRSARLSVC